MTDWKRRTLAGLTTAAALAVLPAPIFAQRGGDPPTPVFWSASEMRAIDEDASTRVSPDTNMAAAPLIGSAFVIYRTGPSEAESHDGLADMIFVREGEGMVLVGGEIVNPREDRPGEVRGVSIEGGTEYPVEAGDTLYVPANMPHQFFVEEGKHWAITIVKVTPQG